MIIKGFSITAGQRHAAHLMRVDENEHVHVQELRGFVSGDLHGAFKEAESIARGTRCKQHLFSCAFSPPESAPLSSDQFLSAINRTERALGLDGQPRAIVFHEKEGRRHAHCVWSRIDAQTMTARQLSHWKTKLREVSRELHHEFGIEMPRGLANKGARDPLNFTHAEWQQAKRRGEDPRTIKEVVQECWAASDGRAAFTGALKERGYFLAQGDRRGFVVVDLHGDVHALSRVLDRKWGSIRTTLSRSLKWLAQPDMQAHIAASGFSLKRAVQNGWSVFVALPPAEIPAFKSWLRLIVRTAIDAKIAMGLHTGGHQTLFLLDEFPTLGRFKVIEESAGYMAGYGMKLVPSRLSA